VTVEVVKHYSCAPLKQEQSLSPVKQSHPKQKKKEKREEKLIQKMQEYVLSRNDQKK